MKNILSIGLFALLLLMTVLEFWIGYNFRKKFEPIKEDWKAYRIEVLNDHKVQCVSGKDTVYLYFENAYKLSEERVVYIEQ